jgi:hypothetical protein
LSVVNPIRHAGWPTEQHELSRDVAARHGDHLDRQRERAEHPDQLRRIDHADEFLRDRSDDLLARERATATLDHGTALRHLVGAIDVNRDVGDVVQFVDVDAVALQPLGCLHGARDRALDPMLDLPELVDEVVRRRSGAHADEPVVDHVLDRLARHRLFLLVLRHWKSLPLRF